jgi:hypothetical protein
MLRTFGLPPLRVDQHLVVVIVQEPDRARLRRAVLALGGEPDHDFLAQAALDALPVLGRGVDQGHGFVSSIMGSLP